MSRSRHVIKAMVWRFAERTLAQIVTFVVSLILARLLSPADFGTVAMVMIFIDVLEVIVVQGFASALVQKERADNIDFSSVFYFGLAFSILLYIIVYFAAPLLNDLLSSTMLTSLLRVLALRLPVSSINSVQQAFIQRNLQFRQFFVSTLIGSIVSAVVGVTIAFLGFGAWAIVFQYLCNTTVTTVVLWNTVRWRPEKVLSFTRLRSLLAFGWEMLASGLIHVLYKRLSSFAIGYRYTTADLAFYEQGGKIPGIIETNIDTAINSVLFPVMSEEQNDIESLKVMVRRSIRMTGLIIWPLMFGLLVLSREAIIIVFTEKWLPCLFFMQISCVNMALEPVQTANLQAIKAIGRSDVYLAIEIVKKVYGIVAIIFCMGIGVQAIACGMMTQYLFSSAINAVANKRLLQYTFVEQLSDILPSCSSAVCMAVVLFLFKTLIRGLYLRVVLGVIVGVSVYLIISYVVNRNDLDYFFKIIRR